MSSFVEIDGKKFQSVGDASKLTGYSRDYIGRLAREQKIVAVQVGRQWFVLVPSLQDYAKNAERELKARQQKLSAERRREREAVLRLREREQRRIAVERRKKNRSKVLAVTALSLGVGLGVVLNAASLFEINSRNQVASTPEVSPLTHTAEEFPVATSDVVESRSLEMIDFSQESMTISTLDADGKGVLLLPSARNSELTEDEVKALFSDPVKIMKDDTGNSYVVRVTADGSEEQLPFAIVPVTNPPTL